MIWGVIPEEYVHDKTAITLLATAGGLVLILLVALIYCLVTRRRWARGLGRSSRAPQGQVWVTLPQLEVLIHCTGGCHLSRQEKFVSLSLYPSSHKPLICYHPAFTLTLSQVSWWVQESLCQCWREYASYQGQWWLRTFRRFRHRLNWGPVPLGTGEVIYYFHTSVIKRRVRNVNYFERKF